jgi:kinetochore protein NDC80
LPNQSTIDVRLPSYMKKREDYAIDLEQFHDLIRQMNEHKTTLEKKVKEKNTELKKTNEQLLKMSQHVDELRKSVATQELSVDDLHKIESEIKGLNEALERTLALKEQRSKKLSFHEEELIKFTLDVDSVVTSYNTKLADLLHFPDMKSQLSNSKLQFNRDNLLLPDQRQIVGIDIQKEAHSLIVLCQDEYVGKHARAKENYHDELDNAEHVEERNKLSVEKLSIVTDKKIKCEQTLESERDSFSGSVTVRQRELDSMERKISSLRDPIALEEQMAAYERQCAELESLRIEHQEENIAKKKAVTAEIYAACKAMNEHDEKFKQAVTQADEYWMVKRDEVRAITMKCDVEL